MAGERAGGGGIGGGGGELACALIRLNLPSKCLGRKERAVSRGGAAVGDGVEPLSDEGEGVGTREEEGVGEAGAVGRPAGVSCKVATPSGTPVEYQPDISVIHQPSPDMSWPFRLLPEI